MILPTLLLLAGQRGPADFPVRDMTYADVVRFARQAGFSDLRTSRLAEGDREIRIWAGFSPEIRSGFLLRKRGATVRGHRIALGRDGRAHLKPTPPPKGGWPALLREVDRRNVATLPNDASLPPDGVFVDDGIKYLVEVRTGKRYRAYYYDNPEDHPKWPTAQALAGIVATVNRAVPGAL